MGQKIGLRSSEVTMQLFMEWLGVTEKIPDWTTIRTWMQRAGVAAIDAPLEREDDWIWMADHSCQIGPEKVLWLLDHPDAKGR